MDFLQEVNFYQTPHHWHDPITLHPPKKILKYSKKSIKENNKVKYKLKIFSADFLTKKYVITYNIYSSLLLLPLSNVKLSMIYLIS